MFSGETFVLTVKFNFGALSMGERSNPNRMVDFFRIVGAAARTTFEVQEPIHARSVSDVFQAVFDCHEKALVDLIESVQRLPSLLQVEFQKNYEPIDMQLNIVPISCGIAFGSIICDDNLLIGDALIQSTILAEEASRRNSLLLIEVGLLPDIYGSYETVELKGMLLASLSTASGK